MLDHWLHIVAICWFIGCWVGYSHYATKQGQTTLCLAGVLRVYREDWMRRMLLRDNRIADASVIGNFERNASFFASSTLAILAGILTVLGASDKAVSLLADLPLAEPAVREVYELKLLVLALVFVYAFFTFTWCMRQYNFAAVLTGAAPSLSEPNISEEEQRVFADRVAEVMSLAAHAFNQGLRAYYFSMALLAWFVSPLCFMLVTAGVVWILYRREFHSDVLTVMSFESKRPLTRP